MTRVRDSWNGRAPGCDTRWLATVSGLCLVICLLAPLHAWAQDDGPVAIEFLDGIETCAGYVLVGDIARFVDGDGALWNRVAAERISYGPQPDQTIKLTVETVLGRLAERGYDWRLFSVSGAGEVRIHGASQLASGSELISGIETQASLALGVAVTFEVSRALPEPVLPEGELEVRLRFPDKPGSWLPDAFELIVDGSSVKIVPLSQYGSFRLPVVVAPEGIPSRTLISAGYLRLEEQVLRPGSEAEVMISAVVGKTTKSRVVAGGLLKFSKLRVPFDIERGDEIVLVINTGGMEMRARAEALNNAYLGQRLLVKRVDDGMRFTGVVAAGPEVVVE